jgi:V8-like Glu-specific endopeptidase
VNKKLNLFELTALLCFYSSSIKGDVMTKLIALLVLATSVTAFAFPTAPFDALKQEVNKQLDTMSVFEANKYDFEGIIKLSNCSGSLIKFSGQPDTSNAYVLTNGHCLGRPFLKPGEAVINKVVNRRMKVADKKKKFHSVTAKLLVYGTMTGTDAAIYELKETYAEIKNKYGVEPFAFDTQRPIIGMDIDIVSGYWERGYRCHIDAFVFELQEAGWTFTDSIRYSEPGCDTIGGTSGSPIIQMDTRTVVAINNTGNESGNRCTMNNPCEVDDEGNIDVIKGASYGQQTYQFYSCLTADFRIDTTKAGCLLND